MADNLEIKVSSSKGTPIIIQEAGPLDVNVQSSPKEDMKMSKEEMKLQILSSVAGAKGDSMYDIAVKHGYTGTEEEFINEFMSSGNGFYNVDNEHPITGGNYTLESAVEVVSSDTSITDETKNGMIITFWDGGEWKTYRYKLFYDPAQPSDFANVDNWEEFKGSGGGGEETGRIILRRESDNMTTKVGSPVHIKFFYDHVTGTGEEQQSTGNAGIAKIIISRAGYTQTLNRTLTAGSHSDIDITRYMGIGVTSVRLQVNVDTGLVQQSAALAWTISEVELNLMSDSLTGYTVVEQGTNLEVAYTLESGSADTKAVILYLDGVQYAQNTVATSVGSGLFNVDTTGLAHGQHTIQLRAQQATGEIDEYEQPVLLYSNLIYTVIGVYTQAGTTPLLTMKVDIADGSTVFGQNEPLSLNLNQYETLTFSYGARSYDNISTEVVIKDGDDTIATATNNRESVEYSVRVLTSGSHSYSVNAGVTAQIAIGVTATEVDLGVEVPSGRTMYLDAIQHGHSNTDANKDTWTSTENGVTTSTVMSGFSWSGDGWVNNALRLKGSARAVVSYMPLQATISGGMTCGFKYKCSDVEEGKEDEKIISCLDSNDTGFFITPNEITIQQNGTVRTTMKTAEGNVYDVAFVVWPASGSSSDARKNARFIYIFIDGISSGGYRLAEGSTMFQPTSVPISIGANGVTTDIYRMWAYSRALNDSEVLDTFILDQDDNIDKLLEKRDDNAILDATGNVTPDSLPDGIRVMIITGQAVEPSSGETMASVLAAAKYNNKSTYFPAMEISSYIKGASDRSKNFIARNNGTGHETGKNIPLRIRLQGTSSLAYPVKNYRIYTNKSTMYVGNNPDMPFGETGELANKGLFAMHDTSAPVNVWCLKADYAESSGTHNTGMARMVNDTFKAISVLTPAQRDVDDTEYPYDVRTTVDGEPCLLFYRETLTDTPIFLGKFNFNNDKSTEAVYGFTGINGYHDVAPLDDIDNTETEFVAQQYKTATGEDLEVDLTECWEFKNNEDPMGSFLDDDFTTTVTDPDSGDVTPRWLGTFEARYPDEDDLNDKFADVSDPIVPHYLSTLVSWVKSTRVLDTDTEQQAAAKLQKFRNELSQYFDVEHLCSYFAFTQFMACLDQMVKNMMMGFWYDKNATTSAAMGKVRAYMIFYDNDTILGIINNGRLLAPYDVQRDTVQLYDAGGNPVYFYAGHESVLWNNLVSQFSTEIRNAYVKIRSFLTNAKIFEYFDRDQASMFCERIYNLDALNKYVAPTGMSESAVAPYRDLMQGSRKSHRRYFVEKRLSLFDNSWRAGEYYSSANEISFKGISAGGSAITLTIRKDGNVEVQSDVSDDFVKNYVVAGNTPTTIGKLTPSAVGTIFHVYGMRQLTSLNLAAWDFDQLNLGSFQYLEEFVFGAKRAKVAEHGWRNSGGYIDNNGTAWFSSGISMPNGYILKCKIYVRTQNNICTITAASDYTSGEKLNSVRLTAGPGYAIMVDGGVANNRLQFDFNCEEICEIETSNITNNQYIKINGETKASATKSITNYASQNINIFRNTTDTYSQLINAKCYYLQLFNPDGSIVRDFWPAIDDNGVACVYDYVTKQYFYNQGTGDFTVSDEVRNAGVGFVEKDNPFTKPYYNSGLILGDSMPRLKRFVAQNLDALPSADLSGCQMIEEIDLSGSKAMSSVNIPVGAPLTKYKLPTAGIVDSWRNSGGYIEADGNQYINLGLNFPNGFKVKVKLYTLYIQESWIVGAYDVSTNYNNNLGFREGNITIRAYRLHQNYPVNQNTLYDIEASTTNNKLYCVLNGTTVINTDGYASSEIADSTFCLGALGRESSQTITPTFVGRIYYICLYNGNDTLVREMYPAIDDNGVACMYDYVTNQYFYNQGTGEFTVSQEVIDVRNFTPYQLSLVGLPRLKQNKDWRNSGGYIEADGNQYINLGLNFPNGFKVKVKLYTLDIQESWIVGAYDVSTNYNNNLGFREGNINIRAYHLHQNYPVNQNTLYDIEASTTNNKLYCVLNGTTVINTDGYASSEIADSTFCLGALGRESSQTITPTFVGRIYYICLYNENDTLVREMYPAIDDNGVACMYDYVTNQFFYNKGTGEFTVSQEVVNVPSAYDGEFNIGVPSKIQSLTFRDCPLINGFDLLTTIAGAHNTALGTVNVTLPSAISGPIADLITIANLWNSNTGEASNLKVYGSYTVTDASLITAQCAAIGYDPSGAATQMSTKIYGLMVTIDQSTISEIVLQSYDPDGEGYNPAVCILLEQANLGSYVDPNDYTKGWYMTKSQAEAVTSLPTYTASTQAGAPESLNNAPYFYARGYIKAVDTHCIVAGNSDSTKTYEISNFDEFKYFINYAKQYLGLSRCFMWSGVSSINIPEVVELVLGAEAFRFCEDLTYIDLPKTLISLGANAFNFSYINGRYYGLKTLICRATTPPTISNNSISWYGQSTYPPGFAIYVPDASVDTYKSASNWNKFASVIKPISELNDNE